MFRKLLISLVAVGLVSIFIAEAANALVSRRRNTVENEHTCNECLPGTGVEEVPCVPDPCFGADFVSDRLYGWDVDNEIAICQMAGTVVCVSDINTCTGTTNVARLDANAFFDTGEFASIIGGEETSFIARDLTDLPLLLGQAACDYQFGDGQTEFDRFWPRKALAHSIYFDNEYDEDGPFPNIPGEDEVFELIELCDVEAPDILYNCTTLWDSVNGSYVDPGGPMPKLPCCGASNELIVQIAPIGGGKVYSNDGKITDCSGECSATYDSTVPDGEDPDGCPTIELTAEPLEVPGANYIFTGWSDNCTPVTENTCTVIPATPAATVTATFESDSFLLTVTLEDNDPNDRVRIFSPSNIVFNETGNRVCDIGQCTVWVDAGVSVVLKKQGDSIDWGGYCTGVPNNNTQCSVPMTKPQEAIVYFEGTPE